MADKGNNNMDGKWEKEGGAWLRSLVEGYLEGYPEKEGLPSLWRTPLISFAAADDHRFPLLREIVGEDHLLPRDILAEGRTVAAYFLPFREEVVESNRKGQEASFLWAKAYVETNKLIPKLNEHIKGILNSEGYTSAFVPPTAVFDKTTLKSIWSHRHVARIAGLGSFGLNNMLITEKGCCGRIGTFVTDLVVSSGEKGEMEYCLAKKGTPCGVCQRNCVAEALAKEEFDRFSCFERCLENGRIYKDMGEAWVCGKCLVGLPCSTVGRKK